MSEVQESGHNLNPGDERYALRAFRRLYRRLDERDDAMEERLASKNEVGEALSGERAIEYPIWHEPLLRQWGKKQRLQMVALPSARHRIGYSGIKALQQLETKTGHPVSSLFLLIPQPMVEPRKPVNRGILLARLKDGRFAELARWGKPLHPMRKVWMWPLRSFAHCAAFIGTLSFACAFVFLPEKVILGPYNSSSFMLRVVFFFYLLLAFGGISILYGFSKVKAFNEDLWQDPLPEPSKLPSTPAE